ncbi:GNAT family N-acetyltransferase [Halobacillus yeomjeoni]|uniref:GNAT family N-acetyltransferase n=1 Tax=Halobacillus yeomjeoni TaxID=311194 RepID=A0A931MU54_9BACI|nr:GNAT family N-acetyltransferase [Halobacillus yeomjeoni]MBH0229110.1 GNAT family N-acetyltransferase [Halobacillus yeomjeoni]
MSHVSICEFTEPYEKQVSELILHIQQEEYNIAITKDDQPDLMNIPSFYQVKKGNFWVAEMGSRVVGTISLLDIGNNEVALRKMFVAEEYRGSSFKIALRLLNRAISWAADHSIKTIFLGTTPQFLAAHKFYQKHGFIKIAQKELPSTFPIVKVDKFFYKFQVENAAE